MAFTLSHGIKEAPRPRHYTYPHEFLEPTGPYGPALGALLPLLKRYWPDDFESKQLQHEITLQLVHECEQAKAWVRLCQAAGEDYEQANLAHREETRLVCVRAIKALEELIRCDDLSAYYLRDAFAAGMSRAVDPASDVDYVIPNQNRDDGGFRVRLDGETRRVIETQSAMRAALGHLDVILSSAKSKLELWTKRAQNPWFQLGNLRFDPPLSRKARAAITKAGDPILGAAILGLAVSLSAWFREISLSQGRRQRWVGEVLTATGRPSWALVADFVNAALALEEPETAESLRQRVRTVCLGREVRIMNWPQAAIREPQVQKE